MRKENIQILDKLNRSIMESLEDIHSSTLMWLAEIISEPLVRIYSEKLWKTEEIPKTSRPGDCRPVIQPSVPGKSQERLTREKKNYSKTTRRWIAPREVLSKAYCVRISWFIFTTG